MELRINSNKMDKSFSVLVFLFFVDLMQGEMDFTYSAADLYRLIETETKLSKTLDNFQGIVNEFTEKLYGYRTTAVNYSSDQIIKNPLLSFELVKRHALVLEELDSSFDEFAAKLKDMQESYRKVRKSFKPEKKDVDNAMEAIVRLRQTYDLNVEELSQGIIGHHNIAGSLSEVDLINVGIYAKESGMSVNAKKFLETGLKQLKKNYHPPSRHRLELMEKAESALNSLPETSATRADREDFRVLTEMDVLFATDSLENLNQGFENLCQIHAVKELPSSNLKCFLDKNSSPPRKISPLKIEVYHDEPQVVVIYDVLSEREIDAIESATFYKLRRSLIQMYLNASLKAERSIIRTTSQTWIHDLDHPEFNYLSKRIESLTGYRVTGKYSAEDLQIASYRPGGHYSLHTDASHEELLKPLLDKTELIQGDRLVTCMIYLSDVEMGGNTVFPMLNVAVKPVKGAAILWGNLHLDGSIARNTLHGACPVIHGIKTIATKWIRANDQMFTRHKCKANKMTHHYNLIN